MDETLTPRRRMAFAPCKADAVNAKVAHLLAMAGERVRSARGRIGISRRTLAEKSGVSLRHLAQLESGRGNISIGLLLRVAEALDLGVGGLLCEAGPCSLETVAISLLLRGASPAQRARALEILAPEKPY